MGTNHLAVSARLTLVPMAASAQRPLDLDGAVQRPEATAGAQSLADLCRRGAASLLVLRSTLFNAKQPRRARGFC